LFTVLTWTHQSVFPAFAAAQVGPYSLLLRQRPGASGNTAHLTADPTALHTADRTRPPQSATPAAPSSAGQQQQQEDQQQQQQQQPDLSNVGLVLWQSGFVLADFLLLRLQATGGAVGSSRGGIAGSSNGSWVGVRVLELGCGGGTVGMFLALAGAQVRAAGLALGIELVYGLMHCCFAVL
jgi:hypothetical protein